MESKQPVKYDLIALIAQNEILAQVAKNEFPHIVIDARPQEISGRSKALSIKLKIRCKIRIELVDGSFIETVRSYKGDYSIHWDCTMINPGEIYRHDREAHPNLRHLATFPKHFHNGTEKNIVESYISDDPKQALREFLISVQQKITLRIMQP